MRKSVERKLAEHREKPSRRLRLPHWKILLCVIAALIIGTVGMLTFLDWKQRKNETALGIQQSKEFAELDRKVKAALQKKIDDAHKAEAEAKVKAAADETARKAAAAAKPAGASADAATAKCDVTDPTKVTIIVNKKHCFNPLSWAPDDLASVDGYLMRAEAASQMIAMQSAAANAGAGFGLSSSYRSYANQVTVYTNWVAVNGSQAAADTVSARPGYSEHQTGLAADLDTPGCVLECFGSSAAYPWLQANAANYGFIERYPPGLTSITGYSPEAWHWRYVGASTAKDMKAKSIQTLEQYFGVSGGDYN